MADGNASSTSGLSVFPEKLDFGECVNDRATRKVIHITNDSNDSKRIRITAQCAEHICVAFKVDVPRDCTDLNTFAASRSLDEWGNTNESRFGEDRSILSELTREVRPSHARTLSSHGAVTPISEQISALQPKSRIATPSEDKMSNGWSGSTHSGSELGSPETSHRGSHYFASKQLSSGDISPSRSRPPSRPPSRSAHSSRRYHESEDNSALQHVAVEEARKHAVPFTCSIDCLTCDAGETQTVTVEFWATSKANDPRPESFQQQKFAICLTEIPNGETVDAPGSGLLLACSARTCMSLIDIQPKILDFGEVNVGKVKVMPLIVTNRSDISTRIDLRFLSKVINTYRGEIAIMPKQSIEIKIDLLPRKVNPEYRKEITVANLLNRRDDQLVSIRSNNIDEQGVAFHGFYYRILTPSGSNFVDFGSTVINAPSLRTFTVENLSDARLALEIYPENPSDVVLYLKEDEATVSALPLLLQRTSGAKYQQDVSMPTSSEIRERVLETMLNAESRPPRDSSGSATKEAVVRGQPSQESEDHQGESGCGSNKDPKAISSTLYLDLAGVKSPKKGADRNARLKRLAQESKSLSSAAQMNHPASPQAGESMAKVVDESAASMPPPATFADPPVKQSSPSPLTAIKQRRTSIVNMPPTSTSDLPLSKLLRYLEKKSQDTSQQPTNDAISKEAYVKDRIQLYKDVRALVHSGRIVPFKIVEIPPRQERLVTAIACPVRGQHSAIHTLPKKSDSLCYFRIVEFDRTLASREYSQMARLRTSDIPIREFGLRMNISRSMMDLGQPHINFGHIEKGQSKVKTIVIQNRSETPLLCHLRKSGSFDSGDIRLSGSRYAYLPAFAKSELEFIFCPSMSGHFQEKVTVENVCDPENSQDLVIKAIIRKAPNFTIEDIDVKLSSEYVLANTNERYRPLYIGRGEFQIENISTKRRTFLVQADINILDFQVEALDYEIHHQGPKPKLTEEEEEEVEAMQQKLKIAMRKNKPEKIKKYEEKLKAFGIVGPAPTEVGPPKDNIPKNQANLSGETQKIEMGSMPEESQLASSVEWDQLFAGALSQRGPDRDASRPRAESKASLTSSASNVTSALQSPTKARATGPWMESYGLPRTALQKAAANPDRELSPFAFVLEAGHSAQVAVKLQLDTTPSPMHQHKGQSQSSQASSSSRSSMSSTHSNNSSRPASTVSTPSESDDETSASQSAMALASPLAKRQHDFKVRLRVHEARNVDEVKEVTMRGALMAGQDVVHESVPSTVTGATAPVDVPSG